jgi:hypothetical protein
VTRSTSIDVAGRRLAAQHLVRPSLDHPADVVRALGAVQSQDYAGAKWAIGLRLASGDDARVERAANEGAIVRTHVLRPTWHFVAPEDLRWMLALTAPAVKRRMATYDRQMGIDEPLVRRSTAAMAKALRGGRHLTRIELGAALRRARIPVASTSHLAHLAMQAELDAVIVSGPRRGKQSTYALVDERVPPTAPLDRDEALLRLTTRYFATRSPATPRDLAWWSGLSVGDARRGIEMAGAALEREDIGGTAYWSDPASRDDEAASPLAHLLPNYDEYFIGYRDRGAIARRIASAAIVTGWGPGIPHVVIVDGQLVGGWKRTVGARRAAVELAPATTLTKAERRAVAAAAERYGHFLGVPTEIR